jgi:ATP-binding cassette subfamily C exporter for protease/lipase
LLFALLDLPWTPIYLLGAFLLHPLLGFVGIAFLASRRVVAWLGHRPGGRRQRGRFSRAVRRCTPSWNPGCGTRNRGSHGHAANLRQALARGAQRPRWNSGRSALGAAHRGIAWSKFVRHTHQSLALAAGAVLVIRGELSAAAMIAANLWINRRWSRPTSWSRSGGRCCPPAPRWPAWTCGSGSAHRACAGTVEDGAGGRRGTAWRDGLRTGAKGAGAERPELVGTRRRSGGDHRGFGAGKSTLARVLVGAWPDVQGEVTLDGHPLETLDRAVLGPRIGYLPQDVELFDGSIADNIARLGQVDPAAVIAAARAAGLHETILQFPQGLRHTGG